MPRPYRLGRRQPSVDRTASSILDAARELVAAGPDKVSISAIARRAGVSRITVYNRFGSRAAVLRAIVPPPPAGGDGLRRHLEQACAAWAASPAPFRNLGADAR